MYKICRTEQSAKRQREIEEALLRLMNKRKYEEISIIELCEESGVPRKAFYRYFDNKEAALQALIDHTLTGYEDFVKAKAVKKKQRRLSDDLEHFFLFWSYKREFLTAIDKNGLLHNLVTASMNFPVNDIISTRRFIPGESDWMRGQIFQFAICGMMFTMIDWFRRGFSESTHEMARSTCRMLSRPLFPDLEELGILSE